MKEYLLLFIIWFMFLLAMASGRSPSIDNNGDICYDTYQC